jgi:hypothetical protein
VTQQTWVGRIPTVSVLVVNVGALCYMSFRTSKQMVHGKNKFLLRYSSPSTLPGHTQTKLANTACAKWSKKTEGTRPRGSEGQKQMARSKTKKRSTRSLHRKSNRDARTNEEKEKEKTEEKQKVKCSV